MISEWNDFTYSESPRCMMPSIRFHPREYIGWKKLFEEFQEGCLVHYYLLYLSGMKDVFLSLFGLTNPIKFLLKRTYGLEEDVV